MNALNVEFSSSIFTVEPSLRLSISFFSSSNVISWLSTKYFSSEIVMFRVKHSGFPGLPPSADISVIELAGFSGRASEVLDGEATVTGGLHLQSCRHSRIA